MKVQELIKMLRADGWYLVVIEGILRQFKHPAKPGRITVGGRPYDYLASGFLR